MGSFKINGGTVSGVPDPYAEYAPRPIYGRQGNKLVRSGYEDCTLHWDYLTGTQATTLASRIENTNQTRVPLTIPARTGHYWRTVYGFIHELSFTPRGDVVTGASAEVTHISNTAE